jgi:hypothetical protein
MLATDAVGAFEMAGIAWVGGVCNSYYGTQISRVNGFSSVRTIAHELGHK